MPSYRKLPSGKWQATVYLPSGQRTTKTDPLKSVVKTWAENLEAELNRGEIRNPRDGKVKIGDRFKHWRERSGLDRQTLKKIDSMWRTHCEPAWAGWPMDAVDTDHAQKWVNQLKATRRARHQGRDTRGSDESVPFLDPDTISEAVHVMSGLYADAMKARPPIVVWNPFTGLELPTAPPRPIQFYEPEEAAALYPAIGRLKGMKWQTLVELGMDAGLRPGELYGLHSHRLHLTREYIEVTHVMTRDGIREYPKTAKSHRSVPIPPTVHEGLAALLRRKPRWEVPCSCPKVHPNGVIEAGRGPCPGLVFPASRGGPIDDGNFRDRIWNPSVKAARTCGRPGSSEAGSRKLFKVAECGVFCDDPSHKIRRFPPNIMRHTAASMLVQAGVPIYEVQTLLGHESIRTTERYAHLAPGAHNAVREAWKKRDHAPGTHERSEAVLHVLENGP